MSVNISIVVEAIVQHQEMVIGPLALDQAKKVHGVKVKTDGSISVELGKGDEKKLLNELVEKYEELFGRASIEVCKDAIKEVASDFPQEKLPDILKS